MKIIYNFYNSQKFFHLFTSIPFAYQSRVNDIVVDVFKHMTYACLPKSGTRGAFFQPHPDYSYCEYGNHVNITFIFSYPFNYHWWVFCAPWTKVTGKALFHPYLDRNRSKGTQLQFIPRILIPQLTQKSTLLISRSGICAKNIVITQQWCKNVLLTPHFFLLIMCSPISVTAPSCVFFYRWLTTIAEILPQETNSTSR